MLEIGCGTGQATVPLAERGLTVTAIELMPIPSGLPSRRITGPSDSQARHRQPPEVIGPDHLPPEAGVFFEEVAARRYPFRLGYSPATYLANLATQAGTRQLGDEGSAEFLARVRARLASLGWPPLTATFVGLSVDANRKGPGAPHT